MLVTETGAYLMELPFPSEKKRFLWGPILSALQQKQRIILNNVICLFICCLDAQ